MVGETYQEKYQELTQGEYGNSTQKASWLNLTPTNQLNVFLCFSC